MPTNTSTDDHNRIGSDLNSQDDLRNARSSHIDKSGAASNSSKALLYYPEENHMPSE